MLENTKKPKNDYSISVSNQPLTKLLKNYSKKNCIKILEVKIKGVPLHPQKRRVVPLEWKETTRTLT